MLTNIIIQKINDKISENNTIYELLLYQPSDMNQSNNMIINHQHVDYHRLIDTIKKYKQYYKKRNNNINIPSISLNRNHLRHEPRSTKIIQRMLEKITILTTQLQTKLNNQYKQLINQLRTEIYDYKFEDAHKFGDDDIRLEYIRLRNEVSTQMTDNELLDWAKRLRLMNRRN